MRRKLIIVFVLVALALGIGLTVFTRPPALSGNFPPGFTDAERRQIISAANGDALNRTLVAIRQGRFREARRWVVNSRRQTVRSIGQQPDGTIWVHFGVPDPKATDGYAVWARCIMTREKDRWSIKTLF